MVCVGRGLQDHLVSTPLPESGTSFASLSLAGDCNLFCSGWKINSISGNEKETTFFFFFIWWECIKNNTSK